MSSINVAKHFQFIFNKRAKKMVDLVQKVSVSFKLMLLLWIGINVFFVSLIVRIRSTKNA